MVDRLSLLGKSSIPLERADRSISLMFRKEIERGMLVLDNLSMTSKDISLWSEMGRSEARQFRGVTPEQQIRSRMCPLECVGKSTCCCSPKLSRHEVKSFVKTLLMLSQWILKSPSNIKFGDTGQRFVRNAENSCRKALFGLGGR